MDNPNKTDNKDLEESLSQPDEENVDKDETSETHYTGVFLSIGAGLGVAYGIMFDNLAIGISLGTALGLVIGAVIESSKKKK
ncbi:hypothetical protein SDC9_148914 [bioreactor metagenome]|uniref:Glycine zipper-like domain-containing protein n=1 Tax=bioreactor metagenome TaxID=1076179 RepID=A0A645EMF3_9ZZZZ